MRSTDASRVALSCEEKGGVLKLAAARFAVLAACRSRR
jgi:hypothetical protein